MLVRRGDEREDVDGRQVRIRACGRGSFSTVSTHVFFLRFKLIRADKKSMEPAVRKRSHEIVDLRRNERPDVADTARPLDAWERYRALNDAVDEAYDVIDISNREARFALIVMGSLNAIIFLAATRVDLLTAFDSRERLWAGVLFGIYAVCAMYFMLQAIETLHPGRFKPHLEKWPADHHEFPVRIRYYEDVIERDVYSHWLAWRDVQIGQLNAELAIHLHSICLKSNTKRVALRRLYAGLRVMTLLLTGLLILFVYATWS